MSKNIMIVGVGGQGTLLASKILGKAAIGNGPVHVELMFVGVCIVALATSAILHRIKLA